MGLVISVLGSALYFSTRPDYDRVDNDLKYRYIKMKGETTPEHISELENLFEINRNNVKIRQMKQDVEEYQQLVKERIAKKTQANLDTIAAKNSTLKQKISKINNFILSNEGKKPPKLVF